MDPKVMGGKPCIRGMRVTVGMIVEAVAAGRTTHELLTDFPYLEAADIREATISQRRESARTSRLRTETRRRTGGGRIPDRSKLKQ